MFAAAKDELDAFRHRYRVVVLAIDANDDGVRVTDESGRRLYDSEPLKRLLSQEADKSLLEQSMEDVRRAALARRPSAAEEAARSTELRATSGRVVAATFTLQLRTSAMEYRLRATPIADTDGRPAELMCVVWVRRCRPHLLTIEQLRERYRLTPREIRVTTLLAARLGSREIAEALGISIHTTRRHAESVLRKLGVRSRADLRQQLSERSPERAPPDDK